MKSGIVILAELTGAVRERVLEIQRRYDPRLAAGLPPHVTITGSSGVGPLPALMPVADLRAAIERVALQSGPITMAFGRPMRFMQSRVVVLPLDPHGPLRALHDRLATSGLPFEPARFTFTPHVTLNLFRELPAAETRALLTERVDEPVTFDRISAHRTLDGIRTERLIDLPLAGTVRTHPSRDGSGTKPAPGTPR